jgi:predicted nucleic acid-binding protein
VINRSAAQEGARIRPQLFKQGKQINAVDVLIAGVTLESGADLVAMDRDFDSVDGLNVLYPGDLRSN